jgi:hypothetical protein
MRLIRDRWVEIGERPRHSVPLMWTTYDESPFTVGEATELATANRLILMHRHEDNRIVAMVYVPSAPKYKRKK